MNVGDYIFHGVFFVLVFGVPIFLAWASATDNDRVKVVDVSDLWKHDGKIDKFAIIILGTWWVHTCAAILWILTKQFTNENVVQYMGWAIPIIARMWAPSASQKE